MDIFLLDQIPLKRPNNNLILYFYIFPTFCTLAIGWTFGAKNTEIQYKTAHKIYT